MNKKVRRGLTPYLGILLIMLGVLYFINITNKKTNYLTYDEFINQMNKGNIVEINITPRSNAKVYEISGKLKDYQKDENFFLRAPLSEEVMSQILIGEEANEFKIKTSADPS